MSRFIRVFAGVLMVAAVSVVPRAQMRVVPIDEERGHVELGLALRHLSNVGIFMQATAHPDDENSALLVMLNRGQGFRTALATATRGNGGQNEIGPEIFEALGVLRTEELAAVHRFDGAEQYFTRAVDFGYSFSVDETFEKWGRDEITADYVRLIRMIRPDVVTALMPGGGGGGQHHQASALIAHDAVKRAADPASYPDQIKAGLRPWQPRKFYYSAGFGFPGEQLPPGRLARINVGGYDGLLGRTYDEIGSEARSMHKCQGMPQLLMLPGPATATYQLAETSIQGQMQKDETSLFDGIDTSIGSLARFAGARPPKILTEGLGAISSAVQAAQRKFETDGDDATLKPILDGLSAVRAVRRELRAMPIDDTARYEIDFRLRQKEGEFQRAALAAAAITVDALGDEDVVVPGQATKVSVIAANRGNTPIGVKQIRLEGFANAAQCDLTLVNTPQFPAGFGPPAPPSAGPTMSTLTKAQAARCELNLTIPADTPVTEPYWHRKGDAGRYTFDQDAPFGLPERPTPFYLQATLTFPGGQEIVDGLPVEHRYASDIFGGEKRSELLVAPALSVRVSPAIVVLPAGQIHPVVPSLTPTPTTGRRSPTGRGASPTRGTTATTRRSATSTVLVSPAPPPPVEREIRVTVVNDTVAAADTVVALEVPAGWSASPPSQPVKLSGSAKSQTVRFLVRPAPDTVPGEFRARATVTMDQRQFDRGYEVVEYPHIRRYHLYHPADTILKVVDVKTAPGLTVGYVMGVGDQVPQAIEQLGAKVEMLGADDLGWGDLSRFDAIVTGVRAYERREDLRANNDRLLQYAFNGGTVIVQYNKLEFNANQYGPYPAKVSANRVTDEHSSVEILVPRDPILTTPNEVSDSTWSGWVQERGLYFLGEKDSRYRDLVQLEDPFPNNKGPKTGALVEAPFGKGRWVYVGLALWRQVPEGVDGAYQLLANLISAGRPANGRTR